MNKELNLITICRRAGKLVMGTDAVKNSCRDHEAKCVLLASDVSAKTLKELRFVCSNERVPIFQLNTQMDDLAAALGKRVGVYSITDKGFYKKFATMTNKIDFVEEFYLS